MAQEFAHLEFLSKWNLLEMKYRYCLIILVLTVVQSCKSKSEDSGIAYSIHSYVGPQSVDSFRLSKTDVYSIDDYLIRVEFINTISSQVDYSIDTATNVFSMENADNKYDWVDTSNISIIDIKKAKQYFCSSLSPKAKIDSITIFRGEKSLLEFEPDQKTNPDDRDLLDTTISETNFQFAKSTIAGRSGNDSISTYIFYYKGDPFYNLLFFPNKDTYSGIKLIMHEQHFMIEYYANNLRKLSNEEAKKLEVFVKQMLK